ncbi:amino acid racemase [uncultured Fretibacterium sp.]|uniref:aspartate/glutamate racemase family protein n=1 Tax=uncultured Fretibacterium sp. TaxID=1678694 RepID=UPI0026158E3C|nr:amino acid racemase [uncultured Fretibacterium sp.]
MTELLSKPEKKLGILGGMGPAAAAEFLRLLAVRAPARNDAQHPHLLMLSDPDIPDRIAGILGTGPDPLPAMRRDLLRLAEWGADLLAVPCNTAHHFIDRLQADLPVPLVHIVEATVDAARCRSPQGTWLLSTSGTRACGIYPACAERKGYRFQHPSEEQQGRVQRCLCLVKAGETAEAAGLMRGVAEELWREKDMPIVTACTELPLAYAAAGLPAEREVSSLQALCDACLDVLYERGGEGV